MIFREETECEWEDKRVPHGTSEEEHERSCSEGQSNTFSLLTEQGRLHEMPDFEGQVGELIWVRNCDATLMLMISTE